MVTTMINEIHVFFQMQLNLIMLIDYKIFPLTIQ